MDRAPSVESLRAIDGTLHVDGPLVSECSEDFGHIVRRRPSAVVRPASAEDIVRTIRFARAHGVEVAVRGQGHSTYGQPLVAGGLVIHMRGMDAIEAVRAGAADVQAGARWNQLLEATLQDGWTPPVLTDYLELTVGGTLSVGGVGGTSHARGFQVDNVTELEVVTGVGEIRTCSAHQDPELFDAALGGLGQVAVIVRATVDLVPAPTHVRSYRLRYHDLPGFTSDQVALISEGRVDHVQGRIELSSDGRWEYVLDAAIFHSTPGEPRDAPLQGAVHHDGEPEETEEVSYRQFANRLADSVALQQELGTWHLPHPWFDMLLPGRHVNACVAGVLAQLDPTDLGGGTILLSPLHRGRLTRPLPRVPDDEIVFQFDILGTAPPDPATISQVIARNRTFFEQMRQLGGVRYPIGVIPFRPHDWRSHLGSAWSAMERAKARYDPECTLNPGHGVFRTDTTLPD
jgi:cytokinin dehydrogenase